MDDQVVENANGAASDAAPGESFPIDAGILSSLLACASFARDVIGHSFGVTAMTSGEVQAVAVDAGLLDVREATGEEAEAKGLVAGTQIVVTSEMFAAATELLGALDASVESEEAAAAEAAE